MQDTTLIDELFAGYNDKLADLLLRKNLNSHYIDVSQCLHQINGLVDTGKLIENELAVFMQLGYQYYRLKDQFMQALIKSDIDNDG